MWVLPLGLIIGLVILWIYSDYDWMLFIGSITTLALFIASFYWFGIWGLVLFTPVLVVVGLLILFLMSVFSKTKKTTKKSSLSRK